LGGFNVCSMYVSLFMRFLCVLLIPCTYMIIREYETFKVPDTQCKQSIYKFTFTIQNIGLYKVYIIMVVATFICFTFLVYNQWNKFLNALGALLIEMITVNSLIFVVKCSACLATLIVSSFMT